MKLCNQKVINVVNGIGNILEMSLPVKSSYAISKNIAKIEKEAEIYNKEREKLLNKYAAKNEDGTLKIDENGAVILENAEGWNKDIKELLEIEVDINIHKFSIHEIENCNMTAREIALIDFMIEE